jgi:hypothetical protein
MITQEQVKQLEQYHGAGMVFVLCAGDDEFAFRRPSELDVDLALADRGAGKFTHHEECAIRCLLTVDAPAAGGAVVEKIVAPELVAERLRLRALWKSAPFTRDSIGVGFAEVAGWNMECDAQAIGGGRYKITARSAENSASGADLAIELTARILAPDEYSEQRKRGQTMPEGAAERYCYSKQVDSLNRDDVARLHPYLVIALGKTILPTLGSEGRSVRVKKFGAGQPPAPGSTSEKQASDAT